MERVTGIGGLVFRACDPAGLARWYERHLGIAPPPATYEQSSWRQEAGPTVVAPLARESAHFPRPERQSALNLRVRDLDALVDQLRAAGIAVEVARRDVPERRFAELADPESTPLQLWEPAGGDAVAPAVDRSPRHRGRFRLTPEVPGKTADPDERTSRSDERGEGPASWVRG